jgi:hypothetical protein
MCYMAHNECRVLRVNYALPMKIKGGDKGFSHQPVWADADKYVAPCGGLLAAYIRILLYGVDKSSTTTPQLKRALHWLGGCLLEPK